jgi:hypothetical protein
MNPLHAILLAISLYSLSITYLYNGIHKDFAKFKTDVEVAQQQAERDADALKLEQEKIIKDVSVRWADAYTIKRPIVRVLRPCSDLPESQTLPTVAPGDDGLQTSSGESWIAALECEQIANDAILDREWIDLAKKFVLENHEASK